MKYDKRILSQALSDAESSRRRAEESAERMRAEVYEKLPRVAEIEAILRTTALEIIRASFSSGGNAAEHIRSAREKNLALQAERAQLLSAAGYSISCTEPVYSCDICSDTGRHGGELCVCIDRRYRAAAARELNSRLVLADASFDTFDLLLYPDRAEGKLKISPRERMCDILKFCKDYAAGFERELRSISMIGGSGLGKTHLATSIARAVADSGHSVVYETAFELFKTYEDEKFNRRDGDDGSDRYSECELLVIDDLGAEMTTSFTAAALFSLINSRLLSKKRTVAVSTLSSDEIRKKYGEQLYSRLFGEFVVLRFCGEDVRLRRGGI